MPNCSTPVLVVIWIYHGKDYYRLKYRFGLSIKKHSDT